MSKNIVETIVGALVLIIAFVFLYFAYKTTEIDKTNGNSYKLIAKFDRADGLNTGSDVRISGVKVGKVIAQNLDTTSYQAVITLHMRKDIQLPNDSMAEIIGNGLLGEKYIAIIPGAQEEYLKENESIQFTQSSVSLESLIGKFIFSSAQSAKNQGAAPKTNSETNKQK